MASKRVFAASSGPSSRPVGTPLALDPRALGVTYEVAEPEDCRYGAKVERMGDVALVRVCGPLGQYASWFDGYESSSWRVGVAERFAMACADAESSAVVLVLDSPGGECAGLFECVKAMRASAAASGKRVVAYVNEAAYSAAYALACAMPEIVLPESGGVGSIGVIAELIDVSAMNERFGINVAVVSAGAHKADGHPDLPISEQALEATAARVAQLADAFYALVSESRPLSVEEVSGLEAACVYGADAVDAGLADGVMGFAELVGSLASSGSGAMAAPEGKAKAMRHTGSIAAVAALGATDLLASPRIGTSPAEAIGAYKKTETSEVTEETESKDEESGTQTTTTTTTTTESETTDMKESEDDKDPDDDGDDDKDKEGDKDDDASKSASAVVPTTRPSFSTSTRDVLAAVRRITGQTSLGAQLGALEAMAAAAARAVKLDRQLARNAVATKVDGAIRAGLLTPAQREWAIAAGTKDASVLDGYLATARPVVAPEPVRMPTEKAHAAPAGVTAEEARIAKNMGIDPTKLAAFKASGGVPTLTH